MSYSISRLTLFAVIGAVETDLREIISNYLGLRTDPQDVLGPVLAKQILERFEKDFGRSAIPPTVEQLLAYIDFADSYTLINANADSFADDIAKHVRSVTSLLEKLVPIRNRVMHSRPLLFDDFATVLDIAEILTSSPDYPWVNVKSTLLRLEKEPSFVLNLEIPSYFEENKKHNLPIPDFDETGFLGRKRQASDLQKHVLGPYPVVSLVGDGGIGKTALALKVAYDVLDMPNCPFEAIVWATSKTTQLTAKEIRRIEGAISDSLGIFRRIADELAGSTDNPMEEVIEYLGAFKILLIIDNLETVLDERIRQFLGMLPSGSKVLITSRIGIGAYEYPQKLQAMDRSEAVDLLRAIARSRGVMDLVRLDNAKLVDFCRRMKYNPGYIKWFVSAVQAGTRPEEVLSRPDVFLDFCMSNVYEYLSLTGRTVLRSMLGLPGRHSLAELAFINDIEANELQPVIYELLRTNMVIMSSTVQGSSFESHYDISDLARTYLTRLYPINPKEFEKLIKRKRQLVAAGEEFQAAQNADPYSFYSLTLRSRSDFIVAKHLVDALRQSKEKNFPAAEGFIQKARDLAPEYFEVHRVEAIVKTAQGNYSAAHSAFEAAIEIEPLSAPLRKWYGGFLMRYMDNTDASLAQFKKAAELDPNSIEVQLEIVRAMLYLRRFDEATLLVEEVIDNLNTPNRSAKKVHDLYLQCFYRKADYLIGEREYADAVTQLENLRTAYESCPMNLRDNRMKEKIANAVQLARLCFQYAGNDETDTKMNAQALVKWFAGQVGIHNTLLSADQVFGGIVKSVPFGKSYGFIQGEDGNEFFFHRSDLKNPNHWPLLTIGMKVTFLAGIDQRGPNAISVSLDATDRRIGTIVRIPTGQNYGFIRGDSGDEYYFNFRSLLVPEGTVPQIGNCVRFAIGTNKEGPCAINVTLE